MLGYFNDEKIQTFSQQFNIPLLILSALIFLCVNAIDYLTTGQLIPRNPIPQFTAVDLARTSFIALSACLVVLSITSKFSTLPLTKAPSIFTVLDFGKGIQLPVKTLTLVWVSVLLAFTLVVLFVMSPFLFSMLTYEDQLVQMASAVFLFIACVNLLIGLLNMRHQRIEHKSFYLAGLAVLAMALFVTGMEEVSWFQRVFGIATPAALSGNIQGEMNLHNLASTESEIFYYFGSFVYLILFPFITHQVVPSFKAKIISFFSPSLVVLCFAAPLAAFNYNLWNNSTIQFAFFTTLGILILFAYRTLARPTKPSVRYVLIALCTVSLLTQVVFIWQGHNFVREWDVTEYKELLMPMAFFVYSLEILMKTKKKMGSTAVLSALSVGLVMLVLRVVEKLNH
jgi:hypothetical protein